MDFSRIFGIAALLLAVLAVTSLASSVQVQEDAPEQTEELELYGRTAGDGSLVRMKRAACDLLEITGNAACAAHCIWLGNRGGRCKGTVCHCRK